MTPERPATIVLFGDSLFAGHGLPRGRRPSALLAHRLGEAGATAAVVAAGVPWSKRSCRRPTLENLGHRNVGRASQS